MPNRELVALGISGQKKASTLGLHWTPTNASSLSSPTPKAKSFQTRLSSGIRTLRCPRNHRRTRSSMACKLLLALSPVQIHLQVSPSSTPSPISEISSNLGGCLLPPTSEHPGASPQGFQGWRARMRHRSPLCQPTHDLPNWSRHSKPYQQAQRMCWHRAFTGLLRQGRKPSRQHHVASPLGTRLLQGWRLSHRQWRPLRHRQWWQLSHLQGWPS